MKILLPIVPVLMFQLICVLRMHTLNSKPSAITKISTVHMFFLFYGIFKIALKVVRFMNAISIKFLVPKNLTSKLLSTIAASIRPPTTVTRSFSYAKQITSP